MGYSPDRPLLNHLKTHLLLEHLKDVCSETDYEGELNTYISDYHTRTDNRPQARYLNWEASYLDASSTKNGLSSRHLTPHPFLHVSHGYHLLGLMHN